MSIRRCDHCAFMCEGCSGDCVSREGYCRSCQEAREVAISPWANRLAERLRAEFPSDFLEANPSLTELLIDVALQLEGKPRRALNGSEHARKCGACDHCRNGFPGECEP
jgi:hypothetical protein